VLPFPHTTADRVRFNRFWAAYLCLTATCLAAAAGCCDFAATAENAEGVRLFQTAHFRDALDQFQVATYNDPGNADCYYNLAATYHRLGRLDHQQCELDQAESYYNQSLDRNPNHCDCHRGLAVLLAEEGRTREAFRLLEGWADRQPGLADPRIELARLYDEYGNREAAKEHLLAALTVDPNNPRALAALGKIREDMGDRTQALANYQRSLWHDRFQPGVACRVAALQSSPSYANVWVCPDGSVQMVRDPANPWR